MPWTPSLVKGFVMFLAVNPFFAIFFTYDVIGALGSALEREMGLQAEEIGWLYSAYSICTPVMVFVSGLLIDKLGSKPTAMLMSSIMVVGAAVVTYGAYQRAFWTMIAGRLAAGFGESLLVAMQAIICQNFADQAWWLNMAFSMSNVWGQLGNASVFLALPFIADAGGLTLAASSSFFVSAFAWGTCLLYVGLDGPTLRGLVGGVGSNEASAMRLRDIREFPASFWCLSLINCLSTCSIFVSMSFGPLFLIESAGYSADAAGVIIALMNATVLLAPAAGWLLDAIGQRVWIWLGCCLTMTAAFGVLALDRMDPVVWLLLIGTAFAVLNSSVNAAISLVVAPRVIGTAYGICGVMFNTSLLAIPSAVGALRRTTGSFVVPMLVFAGINLVGAAVTAALFVLDRRRVLNLPARQLDLLVRVDEENDGDDHDSDDTSYYVPIREEEEEVALATESTRLRPARQASK